MPPQFWVRARFGQDPRSTHCLEDRNVVGDTTHLGVHFHRDVPEVLEQTLVAGRDLLRLETLRDDGLVAGQLQIIDNARKARPKLTALRS